MLTTTTAPAPLLTWPHHTWAQVLCGASLLEVSVPLSNLVTETLEPGGVPAAHGQVLVSILTRHMVNDHRSLVALTCVVFGEGLAPDESVTAGEAAALLDLLPSLGQGHWGSHADTLLTLC